MESIGKSLIPILQVVLFLLPGLVALAVQDYLRGQKRDDTLEKFILALAYSVVCRMVLLWPASHWRHAALLVPFDVNVSGEGSGTNLAFQVHYWEAALLLFVSVLVGAFAAWVVQSEVLLDLAQTLHATRRTTNQNTWRDVFDANAGTCYVILSFKDKRRLGGKPLLYSDSKSNGTLWLENASWLDEQENPLALTSVMKVGMLLIDMSAVGTIEFVRVARRGAIPDDERKHPRNRGKR